MSDYIVINKLLLFYANRAKPVYCGELGMLTVQVDIREPRIRISVLQY